MYFKNVNIIYRICVIIPHVDKIHQ